MNIRFHIFGSSKDGFLIYPQGAANITRNPFYESKLSRLLIINRFGNIITYTFYQKISSDDCIGFRISLNDMQIAKPKALMDMLSEIVDMMIAKGLILRVDSNGKLHLKIDSLAIDANEVEALRTYITSRLVTAPQTFGCGKLMGTPDSDEIKTANYDSPDNDIETMTYASTCVYIQDKNPVESYIQWVVKSLDKSLEKARKSISDLTKEKTVLVKQKKQFRVVLILLVLLLCAGGGIFSINSNLNSTRANLYDANERIHNDSLTIIELNTQADGLRSEINSQKSKIKKLEVLAQGLHSHYFLPDWYSTNHTHNSTSSKSYNFYAYEGDILTFDYYVDSEHADYFRYSVTGPSTDYNGRYSGSGCSGSIEVPITSTGHFLLSLSYSKDVSINQHSDQASVYNIHLTRGDIKELQDNF